MTRYFNHHTAALVLAVITTLAIFSGVSSLSQPSPAAAMWVQAQTSTAQS